MNRTNYLHAMTLNAIAIYLGLIQPHMVLFHRFLDGSSTHLFQRRSEAENLLECVISEKILSQKYLKSMDWPML